MNAPTIREMRNIAIIANVRRRDLNNMREWTRAILAVALIIGAWAAVGAAGSAAWGG